MLPGSVFLFGQEEVGGGAGRKINRSVEQQRGPTRTGNDSKPATEEYDTFNPVHLILLKEDTSAVKINDFPYLLKT